MRFTGTLASLAVAAGLAAGPLGAAPAPRLFPGFGVTPGGLVWAVGLRSRTLVLRDPDGVRRLTLPLGPDEGHVLGVADDGARVTARQPGGLARAGDLGRLLRLAFRAPDGTVRANREVERLDAWTGTFLGDAAYVSRREGPRRFVDRVNAEGETRVGEIPADPLEDAIGRPGRPELHVSPDGVAVSYDGRGRAYVRLDSPAEPIVPDPDAACGFRGPERAVLPSGRGVLRLFLRVPPAEEDEAVRPKMVAEAVDPEGVVTTSVELGELTEALGLPGGGLLLLDGHEAVPVDARLTPGAPVPFPLDPDEDTALSARVAELSRRIRSLGPRAGGADWAELAVLPGGAHEEFLAVAGRDPEGAVRRLARVPDGDPDVRWARSALHDLVLAGRDRAAEEGSRLAEAFEAATLEGAPLWLARFAGLVLLVERKGEAPPWAPGAAAEALAEAGDEDLAALLPDEVMTLELAETIAAVDRARLDAVERARPEVAEAARAGLTFPEESEGIAAALRYHVPAERFPRTLLACASGPPSLRVRLVLERLTESVFDGGVETPATIGRRGEVAAALLEAQQAEEPGLRAVALALGPFFGLPTDPVGYRREVLSRPDLGFYVLAGLVADRSLPARTFAGLLLDQLERTRRASRDPWRCTLFAPGDQDGSRDPYCDFFALTQYLAEPSSGDDGAWLRLSRERMDLVREWTRSSGAPPEVRLDAALRRAVRGAASEDELLELWRSPDLPPRVRRVALAQAPVGSSGRLAAVLERELSGGRASAEDRSAMLRCLTAIAPAAAAAHAAAEWKAGRVPLDVGDFLASAWVKALEPSRVASDDALRAALSRAAGNEAFSVDVALLLALAHGPGSAEALARELRRSCRSCRGASELAEAFGGLGPDGVEALAGLAAGVPRSETTPLEALFSLAPDRALEIAVARFRAALERGCVAAELVPLLARSGADPFPEVALKLADGGCSRRAVSPEREIPLGGGDGGNAERLARRTLAAITSPLCRKAFARLFDLDERERGPGLPGTVTVTTGENP